MIFQVQVATTWPVFEVLVPVLFLTHPKENPSCWTGRETTAWQEGKSATDKVLFPCETPPSRL